MDLQEAIDGWIEQQGDSSVSKPEAVRRLLWKALRG
jgi:hypothetical protein